MTRDDDERDLAITRAIERWRLTMRGLHATNDAEFKKLVLAHLRGRKTRLDGPLREGVLSLCELYSITPKELRKRVVAFFDPDEPFIGALGEAGMALPP